MTAQDALRQLTALSHFSLEQLDKLDEVAEVLSVRADHVVERRGEETSRLYGLVKGGLTVQKDTPHGDFALDRLRPGDLFGEAEFVDHKPRDSDVVSGSESELIRFDTAKLKVLCATDQRFDLAVHWAMWNSMSSKLRMTTRMLSHFFAGHNENDATTTVGPPEAGKQLAIEARAKRDLFLKQGLSHLEANFLASLSAALRYSAGQTIFREREDGDSLYFVVDGEVRISKNIPGTGEEALAILKPGEIFGEMSLVDGRPRSADAVAHEADVELLVVPATVIARLLDIDKLSSPVLLKTLCRAMAGRLRSLHDKMVGWHVLSGGASTVIGGRSRDIMQA